MYKINGLLQDHLIPIFDSIQNVLDWAPLENIILRIHLSLKYVFFKLIQICMDLLTFFTEKFSHQDLWYCRIKLGTFSQILILAKDFF